MAVCETWLDERISDSDLEIPGFNTIIIKDRPGEAYGGVGLYLRQEVHFELRKDLETNDLELLWVTIWGDSGKYLLGVCYRPPSALTGYWDRFIEIVDRAMGTDMPVILMGDFNCNILDNPNKLEDLCQNLGLRIINKDPTHFTDQSATCIDVAITSTPTKVSSIYTTSPNVSNHCGLILTMDSPPPKAHSYKRKVRKYHQTDWQSVNQAIRDEEWPEGYVPLEELTLNWTTRFQQIVEDNTPSKIIRVEPWSKAVKVQSESSAEYQKCPRQQCGQQNG